MPIIISAEGPEVITILSSEGSLKIADVMFGDIWLCSGQSNMQFTLSMVNQSDRQHTCQITYMYYISLSDVD